MNVFFLHNAVCTPPTDKTKASISVQSKRHVVFMQFSLDVCVCTCLVISPYQANIFALRRTKTHRWSCIHAVAQRDFGSKWSLCKSHSDNLLVVLVGSGTNTLSHTTLWNEKTPLMYIIYFSFNPATVYSILSITNFQRVIMRFMELVGRATCLTPL